MVLIRLEKNNCCQVVEAMRGCQWRGCTLSSPQQHFGAHIWSLPLDVEVGRAASRRGCLPCRAAENPLPTQTFLIWECTQPAVGHSTGSSCGRKQESKEVEGGKPFQIRGSLAMRQSCSQVRERQCGCGCACSVGGWVHMCVRVFVVHAHRRQKQQSLIYCDKMNSPQDAHPAANFSSYLLCE